MHSSRSGSFSGETNSAGDASSSATVKCAMCGKQLGPIDSRPEPLNSNDDLYDEIRDSNIQLVQPRLNERAKELSRYEQSRHDMQDLNEFGRFVKNLQNLQLDKKRLAIHIDLLQSITSVSSRRAFLSQWQSEQAMIERGQTDYDMLEDAIAEEVPLVKLLRMLCLQSLCCGGFKKFDQFRREILQTYGYEYVFTLDNLEKLGFFRKSGIWDWPAIRRAFRLVVDNPT